MKHSRCRCFLLMLQIVDYLVDLTSSLRMGTTSDILSTSLVIGSLVDWSDGDVRVSVSKICHQGCGITSATILHFFKASFGL